MIIIKTVLILLYLSALYYLFGVLASNIFRLDKTPAVQLIYGIFFYNSVFLIYDVPMKWFLVRLDIIAWIWFPLVTAAAAFIAARYRDDIVKGWKATFKEIRGNLLPYIFGGLYALGYTAFGEIYGRTYSYDNQLRFLGYVTQAVEQNSIDTFDQFSGFPKTEFSDEYFFETFMDHSAALCKLTGLHPLIEVKNIESFFFLFISMLVIWKIARGVSGRDRKKALLFFIVYNAISNFFVVSPLMAPDYGLFRMYEGKTEFAVVALPLLMYEFWKMYDEPEKIGYMWKIILITLGSTTYSMSVMFVAPFFLLSYIPCLVIRKDWRLVRNWAAGAAVCGFFAVYWYLCMKGVIDLTFAAVGGLV